MSIETLGEAYRLSWRVRVRCVRGYIESPVRVRPCGYQAVLDMQTLVWAKGRSFPLGRLGSRLMCPVCGNRDVNVIFEPPPMVRTVVAGNRKGTSMSDEEWLPETEPRKRTAVVTIDRRPLSQRAKLVDRGLVDFRRVCDQMGILDRETDTIRSMTTVKGANDP